MRFNRNAGFGILLVVVIFILTAFVSAQDSIVINKYSTYSDFNTGAYNAQPNVCICGDSFDKIFIENTGSFHTVFNITTNRADLVTLPFSSIELAPGQKIDMDILISADCSLNEGSRDYVITIANNYGTVKELRRSLDVNECQTISAQLFASKNEINPCQPVNYTINLTNPATFSESYLIRPLDMSEYFSYPEYTLDLMSGQSGYVQTVFEPACSIYGNESLRFEIIAKNSGLKALLAHDLNIKQNYSFDTYVDQNIDLCQYSYSGRDITIKNTAGVANNYTLRLNGAPAFAVLNETKFGLLPGESKIVNLDLEPGDGSKGTHFVDLEVDTEIGDASVVVPLNLSVSECYDLSLNIDNPFKTCTGDRSFDLEVSNTGKYNETVLLSSDSEFILVPSEVVVGAGDTKTVRITSSVVENQSKVNIPFKITATLKDRPTWLSWKDNANIVVYEQYLCTYPVVYPTKISARYNTSVKALKITNDGLENTTYDVAYSGSSWLSVSEKRITLGPKESGYLTLNLYNDSSEVQNKYYFDLNLTSENNDRSYVKHFELVMTDASFLEKGFNYVVSTPCTLVSAIIVLLIILALIFLFVAKSLKIKADRTYKIVIASLILLVIIATFAVFGFPKSNYPALDKEKVENPLYLVWYQDHAYRLDLSDYFKDPDNDALNFSVQDVPANFTVSIKDSIVTLRPDNGWNGTARVKFSAVDIAGDDVVSPSFDLEVVPYEKLSFEGFYFKYCPYINAVLLIILLALLLLLPCKKDVKKKVAKKKVRGKVALTKIKREKGYLYFVDKDGDVSRKKIKRNSKSKK